MDMGRTCVNLIGNCLATVVVARWEGEFDDDRARIFGTPEEIELDLREGETAFAEAVGDDNEFAGMKLSAQVGSERLVGASAGGVKARPSVWRARWEAFRFSINPGETGACCARAGNLCLTN